MELPLIILTSWNSLNIWKLGIEQICLISKSFYLRFWSTSHLHSLIFMFGSFSYWYFDFGALHLHLFISLLTSFDPSQPRRRPDAVVCTLLYHLLTAIHWTLFDNVEYNRVARTQENQSLYLLQYLTRHQVNADSGCVLSDVFAIAFNSLL